MWGGVSRELGTRWGGGVCPPPQQISYKQWSVSGFVLEFPEFRTQRH